MRLPGLEKLRAAWRYRRLCSLSAPFHSPTDRPWGTEQVGRFGEDLALLFLKAQGCKLLLQNYRSPAGGEADIVVRDREALVFVEVKTRTREDEIHRPRDAVNREKRNLIRRASRSWRKALRHPVCYRYDIIEVLLLEGEVPRVNWVKDAFQETEQSR